MTFLRRACLALAALASLAVSIGCIAPTPPGPAPDPQPTPDPMAKYPPSGKLALEVGTGDGTFTPLADGMQVDVNYGPQGGEHIWLAVRCKGAGSPANITYRIDDEDGNVVSDVQQATAPSKQGQDGWRSMTGLTAFLDVDPASVAGKKVVFKAHLDDSYGSWLDAKGEALVQDGGGTF
jgi:hypothetical protein